MARLFISHSSANNAHAVALRDWLAEQGFADVFLDIDPERGLVAGDRWQQALKAAVDRCEAVLVLISPAWLDSKWCLAEFLLAKTLHKRIFGLVVERVALDRIPGEMTAEWQLSELVGEDRLRTFEVAHGAVQATVAFREAGLSNLRSGLERAGLDARSFPWPPAGDPRRAPYRGLRALEPEDAAIFFGRDAMIVRALDQIRGVVEQGVTRLLIVLGASGSGKSSFLRAGLLPRLARDDLLFLPLPVLRPESAVISGNAGLAVTLAGAFERLGAPRSPGRIKETISEGAGAFCRLLVEVAGLARRRIVHVDDAPDPTLVLSIDQAEELFNPEGADEARVFLGLLAAMLATGDGAPAARIIVLATLRSDRYELLQAEPAFAAVKRELVDLSPIPPSEFKSVIEGPARRVVESGGRLAVDPALTEQLIADAAGADALPLLSFTLERLYADFGAEGRLTLADYHTLGGVRGSIEAAVAQAFAEPGRAPTIPADKEEQLAAARAAFIPWLARIAPETGVPIRRVARVGEIPARSRAIVERLVGARLLVADRRASSDVLEVAHESLLRQWPALAAWLEADAGDLKVIDGVERAATEWAHNGKLDAWLDHRAERLSTAERLTAREDFRQRLGDDGAAYLAACRSREDAERREREEALVREQARLAEIADAQTRTARNQKVARWALVVTAMAVMAGLAVGWWERRTNLALKSSLDVQQSALAIAQSNLFIELAIVERLRGNFDAALRFAVHADRLNHRGGATARTALPADVELVTAMSQARWRLSLGGHGAGVSAAAFSPDGKRIVTAGNDMTARIWDSDTGREIAILRGHTAKLWSAAFSADGSRIVTAAEDKTARIWDAANGQQIAILSGHDGKVTSAQFSPDGRRIVTSSFDRTIRLWDAATGQQIAVLRGHDNTVQSARFSRDGKRIVSASDDRTARVWDAETGQQLAVLRGHQGAVYYADFSPDGLRIVTGSDDTTARLWDAASGRELKVLRGHGDYVNWAVFSPAGSRILTASADKTARVWDAATGQPLAVLRGHEDHVNAATFSPDGRAIVTASSDQTARVWNAAANKEIMVLRGHASWVLSAVFSPDGRRVLTASQDQTARIWDVASGRELAQLRGHEAPVWFAAFSRDGKRIVTASEDRTARVWDASSGAQLVVLRGHENWVMSAAFSPDGRRVVTGSWDGTARIFDVATGQQITVLRHGGIVDSVAFSPDGKRIVTGSRDKTARVWDAASGQTLATLRGHDGAIYSVAFSPDGARIVTASQDRSARIWDARTGNEIIALRGHDDAVWSAAFSPEGTRVVTASQDKTARIWDAASGRELAVLNGHDGWVVSAAYSPDGARIVTASRDGTARLWSSAAREIPFEELIGEACMRRLGHVSKLTLDDMQLAGFPASVAPLDVCAGVE